MSDEEKADFLEKLLADTDRLIELARSIRKHRDEEWLSKMESLLSIAISNLGGRVEVQAVGKFVNEMRQWAKGEE